MYLCARLGWFHPSAYIDVMGRSALTSLAISRTDLQNFALRPGDALLRPISGV